MSHRNIKSTISRKSTYQKFTQKKIISKPKRRDNYRNNGLSKGELMCIQILKRMGIKFRREVHISSTGRKRFDFYFKFDGEQYLIEIDGKQHFIRSEFFHPTINHFYYEQENDIYKTCRAIEQGFNVIRIDYENFRNIEQIIRDAIGNKSVFYASDRVKYNHILIGLRKQLIIV